jgi:hypothetical protein
VPEEPTDGVERPVDLRRCKRALQRLYPPGNPLREAVLAEPDFLTLAEAAVKIPFFLRMVGRLGEES